MSHSICKFIFLFRKGDLQWAAKTMTTGCDSSSLRINFATWRYNFQLLTIIENEAFFQQQHFLWRQQMARLRSGEKDQIKGSVHNLIRRHDDTGLWESDIARLTQLDRRRLNNYLNELKKEGKVYKDGQAWHAG